MSSIIQFVEYIVWFSFIIVAHEFGHFVAARLVKVKVSEFGLGYPPKLFKLFTWRGTDFTVNALPFGGFIKLPGENTDDVDGFQNEKAWKRLVILLAGPVVNIALAIVLFTAIYSVIGSPDPSRTMVTQIIPESAAYSAGVLVGDQILAVDGSSIISMSDVSRYVLDNQDDAFNLSVARGDEIIEILVPKVEEITVGQGPLGIQISNPMRETNVFQSMASGVGTAYEQVRMTLSVPMMLITGKLSTDDARILGPIGIFELFGQVKNQNAIPLGGSNPAMGVVWFMAVISLAVGVTNLLPIPALDGGQIMFALPELLFRKKIPIRMAIRLNHVGFALVMVLFLYTAFQDIVHILQ